MSRIELTDMGQTEALGRRLGGALRPGDVILLEGVLGAGKTALVRAIAGGLGSHDDVASPTFVLVRHYRGRLPLVHADLYRLEDAADIDHLGLLELAEGGVLAVEWADRAPSMADGRALHLRLRPGIAEQARSVEVISTPAHLEGALRSQE